MRPASEAVSEAPRKRARASPESFSEVTSSGHAGDQSFSHHQQIACECPSGLSFSEIARLRDDLLAQCGAPQADTPEAFAFSILEKRTPSKEDVLLLARMLPLSPSPRDERAKSFSSGASVHGGAVNVRKTCGAFPFSSLAVTSYIRATAPECTFSTFSLLFEDEAKPHKDLQNHSCENYVFPLSNFSGGELWVEGHGPEQRTLEGKEVTGGPLSWRDKNFVHFRADTQLHFVLPWEGSRVVLVAFCIRFFGELGAEKLATLASLGFRLPTLPEVQGQSAVLQAAVTSTEDGPPVVPSPPAVPTEPPASPAPRTHEPPLFIEVCAGSALLSSLAREAGFSILPIDGGQRAARSYAHVLRLDLREGHTLQFLQHVLQNRVVAWVHFSPPTGSISAAFRSKEHPRGLPGLPEPAASKVAAANKVYDNVVLLLQSLQQSFPSVGFSIEHPLGSPLWDMPALQELTQSAWKVQVALCSFGASFARLALFVSNRDAISALESRCPGCPRHSKPPGSGVRMDGHYPKALCESVVKLMADSAVAAGLQLEPLAISTLQAARSAGQVQPRVSKYPPLISEFAHSVTVRAADAPLLDSKSRLRVPWHAVPVGSRLLRTSQIGDPKRPQLPATQPIVASLPAYTFGVYREPCTFLREAKLLRHPFDTCRALPDGLLRVLHFILVQGPVGVMRHRLNVFKLWQRWAAELEPAERQFRETLHQDVKAVLGNKRILLMRKIASSLGWPDVTLWDDLAKGFKLTGSQPRTGVFDPDCKPAVSSESEFWMAASAQRNATWSRVEKAQFQDYAGPLWEITLEEADPTGKRWLHGPLTRDEVDSLFPEGWMPCRRFAVWQGKWRPIDDFSENGVNACFECFEKVSLKALDEVTWVCMYIMKVCRYTGAVDLELSDGTRLRGPVHACWKDSSQSRPQTKAYDLKSAYKQLPLNPLEQPKAVIVLKGPRGAASGFVCKTLPFGASASVLHFNRVALFLQRLLWEVLVLASCYFDDFPAASPAMLAQSTDKAVHALMDLLHFQMATPKEHPFASVTHMLGVVVDTSDPSLSCVRLGNKPERTAALSDALGVIIASRKVEVRTLPALFGRLQFAEAQILGRTGRLAIADVRRLEHSRCEYVDLEEDQLRAFKVGYLRVPLGPFLPRLVSLQSWSSLMVPASQLLMGNTWPRWEESSSCAVLPLRSGLLVARSQIGWLQGGLLRSGTSLGRPSCMLQCLRASCGQNFLMTRGSSSLTIQVFLDLASLARRPSLRGVSFFYTSKLLTRQAPACHGSLECRVIATLRTRRRGQSGRSLSFLNRT